MSEKPQKLAYIVGEQGDKVTVCVDCAEDEYDDVIRNVPNFGDQVPYPECWVCGEVARPETLSTFDAEREVV